MKTVRTKVQEKRLHPRVPVGLSLDVHAQGLRVQRVRGKIVDLSVGGMAFETEAELDQGASLYLKVNIPLFIRGEVRYMGGRQGPPYRYGVRFHKIGFGAKDEARPERFISAQFERQRKQ